VRCGRAEVQGCPLPSPVPFHREMTWYYGSLVMCGLVRCGRDEAQGFPVASAVPFHWVMTWLQCAGARIWVAVIEAIWVESTLDGLDKPPNIESRQKVSEIRYWGI
jgi:hypothetical protein